MKQYNNSDYLGNCFVLLPALNEESSITKVIKDLLEYVPACNILVIDNGSTDKTSLIAKELGVDVTFEPKRGKSYAVRRGFSLVPPNITTVFLLDSDDTYDVSPIVQAVKLVIDNNIDMVVGCRKSNIDKSRKPAFKKSHYYGNLAFTKLSNLLSPTGIEDVLSGWRVMSIPFVRSFTGSSNGFEIESELNGHAFLIKSAILNLDIEYRGRKNNSDSKLKTYSDGFKILRMKFKLFSDYRPKLAFTLFSIPWVLASTLFIGRSVNGYLETGLVSQFPSLIVGTASFIIAVLLIISGVILQKITLFRSVVIQLAYKQAVK